MDELILNQKKRDMLKKTVKKQIGKTTHVFQLQAENLHELIMESKKMSFPDVLNCNNCNSSDLILDANKAKSHNFTFIRCLKCNSKVHFSNPKENSDVFYLKTRVQKNDGLEIKVLDWRNTTNEKV